MTLQRQSVTFVTSRIKEAVSFYKTHFAASEAFDCGWYVVLRLEGERGIELCFMEPQNGAPEYKGGTSLNLLYDEADAVYRRLSAAGLEAVFPLDDHPWGDRGFAVLDPLGTAVYCHHAIEPSAEFKGFYK